ncbi:hypothetical protein GTY54_12350, partial [Streptomyces sp. SID625]|nr:hypothetical protein [Streptomyces sp. SID625]
MEGLGEDGHVERAESGGQFLGPRGLLLRSLAPGTVRWGRTLASVDGPAGGPRTL